MTYSKPFFIESTTRELCIIDYTDTTHYLLIYFFEQTVSDHALRKVQPYLNLMALYITRTVIKLHMKHDATANYTYFQCP